MKRGTHLLATTPHRKGKYHVQSIIESSSLMSFCWSFWLVRSCQEVLELQPRDQCPAPMSSIQVRLRKPSLPLPRRGLPHALSVPMLCRRCDGNSADVILAAASPLLRPGSSSKLCGGATLPHCSKTVHLPPARKAWHATVCDLGRLFSVAKWRLRSSSTQSGSALLAGTVEQQRGIRRPRPFSLTRKGCSPKPTFRCDVTGRSATMQMYTHGTIIKNGTVATSSEVIRSICVVS